MMRSMQSRIRTRRTMSELHTSFVGMGWRDQCVMLSRQVVLSAVAHSRPDQLWIWACSLRGRRRARQVLLFCDCQRLCIEAQDLYLAQSELPQRRRAAQSGASKSDLQSALRSLSSVMVLWL